MNNGNLLNTLMGVSSTNAAAAKTNAAKTRVEAGEKFQQALEQARPEVAARKPVTRKDRPASTDRSDVARNTPKPATQRAPVQESSRTETSKKPETAGRNTNSTEKCDSSTTDEELDKPTDSGKSNAQESLLTSNRPNEPVADATENLLALDPAVDLSAMVELSEDALLAVTDGEDEAINPEPADLQTDIDPSLQDPALLASLVTTPVNVVSTTDEGLSINSTLANQTAAQIVGGTLSGKALDGLKSDTAATDASTESSAPFIAADDGENPDFLLLNSKAALNKLMETNLAANTPDKSAAATDLAKPTAVGALVESLGRLGEAQSPAARAFVVQTGVPVTVGTPQWSQAVGDKVLWLAAQNVSSAEIRLDPPELGPMQVKVSVNQDQTSITFTSPHPVVREALDQQLNRLREMFSEQGLNLVNVDVSDKSFAQQEREQGEAHQGQANSGVDDEVAPVAVTQAISMRLVDHYA